MTQDLMNGEHVTVIDNSRHVPSLSLLRLSGGNIASPEVAGMVGAPKRQQMHDRSHPYTRGFEQGESGVAAAAGVSAFCQVEG